MGNISTILTSILCLAAPIATLQPTEHQIEQNQPSLRLGKERVAAVRAAYTNGHFDTFLKEMDASYKDADKSGMMQIRENTDLPADYFVKEKQFFDLQKLKNKELLAAVSDKDDSIFAQKVRSVGGELYTPEQDKAISKLHSFMTKLPNSGANSDENTLIDLDFEYEYKLLHIYMPQISEEERSKYTMALRMEKMERMVEAAKSFHDLSLKQAVAIATAHFDDSLARNLDGNDLNKLVKEKAKPTTALEEKVYSILSSYQAQFKDVMK